MSKHIDVDFSKETGQLEIWCDADSFASLRQSVADRAAAHDVPLEKVSFITIASVAARETVEAVSIWRRPKTFGCFALIAAIFVFVAVSFGIGVATIVRWIASGI